MTSKRKNPVLAALLSFLLAGLGQLYLGRIRRGILFFILEIITAVFSFYGDSWLGTGGIESEISIRNFGYILNLAVSLWAAYDAYVIAKKINMGIEEKYTDGILNSKSAKEIENKSDLPEVYIR